MTRRAPYTRLQKKGQLRPDHVKGMGDVVFKGFQCLEPSCRQFVFVRADEIAADFLIPCPDCGFELAAGEELQLFDYRLMKKGSDKPIEEGQFAVLHDEYLADADLFKYCIYCYTLKPLDHFDRHGRRRSGRQGECRLCKTIYNGIKNQSRIADQHREAAQRRRLYRILAGGEGPIDSRVVYERFKRRCFSCSLELDYSSSGTRRFQLDHTLPARLLWPLTTENATLLCGTCNRAKHGLWPSEFYKSAKIRPLARLTGYEFALLAGPPQLNEEAVATICEDPDSFIEEWIHCPGDIQRVRQLVLEMAGIDLFEKATEVPAYLLE